MCTHVLIMDQFILGFHSFPNEKDKEYGAGLHPLSTQHSNVYNSLDYNFRLRTYTQVSSPVSSLHGDITLGRPRAEQFVHTVTTSAKRERFYLQRQLQEHDISIEVFTCVKNNYPQLVSLYKTTQEFHCI